MPETENNLNNNEKLDLTDVDIIDEDDGLLDIEQLRVMTASEIGGFQAEAAIRQKQLDRINEDRGVAESLFVLPEKAKIWEYVYAIEKFLTEAYSFKPYYVPDGGKMTYPQELDTFYEFVPISPRNFPDSLFERALGITFKYNKRTKEGAIEREPHFKKLREFFERLLPVPYRNFNTRQRHKSDRMMIVPKCIDQLCLLPDDPKPEYEDPRGSFVVSRKQYTTDGPKRVNNFYLNIYEAIRGMEHTLESYVGEFKDKDLNGKGEIEVLLMLQREAKKMIGFLQKWKYTTEGERQEASKLIREYKQLLNDDIDLSKVLAREQFEKSESFKDSTGKYNKGAASARLVAACNRLNERVNTILKMKKEISTDIDTLQILRHKAERKFDSARREISGWLEDEYFIPFTSIKAAQSYLRANAKGVNNRLYNPDKDSGIMADLKQISMHLVMPAPFPQWADAVRSNMGVVYLLNNRISKLETGEIDQETFRKLHDKVCEYAIRSDLVLRYQNVQQKFVKIIETIIKRPNSVRAEDVNAEITKLREELDPAAEGHEYRLRPDIIFNDPAFTDLSLHLDSVRDLTNQWIQKTQDIINSGDKLKEEAVQPDDQMQIELILNIKNEIVNAETQYLDDIKNLLRECDFAPAQNANTFNPKARSIEILNELGIKHGLKLP